MAGKLFMSLIVACLGLTVWNRPQAVEDQKMIEGTWTLLTAELAGQKLPDAGVKDTKLILADGRYTYRNAIGDDIGVYKLSAPESPEAPKAMDITGTEGPNKGKTFLAIYELTGDTLKICYDLTGKARPEQFATKAGTKHFLATYKRATP
jgi:uncharacterized protein (TIGR03067 family)